MSAAAGSRWWPAGPCPAARRPCCRPAHRQSTTSNCAVRAQHRSRTRDLQARLQSQATPPGENGHWNLQEIRKQPDAEDGHDCRKNDRTLPGRGFVAEGCDEDTGEGRRRHSKVASEEYEKHRAHQDAEPGPPLRAFWQDTLIAFCRRE